MRWFALLAIFWSFPALCAPDFTIGSKRFTESYILAEIVKQVADQTAETRAIHRQGLGNTGIVFAALKGGSIALYPEYTGTIGQEVLKQNLTDLKGLNRELAPLGLAAGIPLGFNNTYAFAMRDEQAERLGIRTVSDLARHPQ
ncbi:MAG: amino acid ABC transporter permease, partial [Gemmatimonadaceae bacterium]|nr:amino acid ABC transporter permease [Gloeobacterales cyanobacterium ES-bin-141]